MGASTNNKKPAVQLLAALRKLQKKPCLFYIVSREAGSFVDVHFGTKRQREAPLALPGITQDQAQHEGELSLYITCAWRVESASDILCGCWDDAAPHGQMRQGLDRLVGQRVVRVLSIPPAFDLTIELDGGVVLRVFCDQTNDEDGADNYSLFTREQVFTVGTMSDIFVEPRQAGDG